MRIRFLQTGPTARSLTASASCLRPTSSGCPRPASITPIAASGAGKLPPVRARVMERARWKARARPKGLPSISHPAASRGRNASRRRSGGRPLSSARRRCACSMSHAPGTARATSPMRSARRPSSERPVRIRSRAADRPTSRGRRVLPPKPGKIPSSTSGRPIWVCGSSLATLESQANASSVPPPRHTPSIAATVGQASEASRPNAACARRTISRTLARSVTAAIAWMSAPAMNEPALPLLSTTPRSPAFFSSSESARSRSAIAASSSRLTLRSGSSMTRWASPRSIQSTLKAGISRAPG